MEKGRSEHIITLVQGPGTLTVHITINATKQQPNIVIPIVNAHPDSLGRTFKQSFS